VISPPEVNASPNLIGETILATSSLPDALCSNVIVFLETPPYKIVKVQLVSIAEGTSRATSASAIT
jgi:hypothetical protein